MIDKAVRTDLWTDFHCRALRCPMVVVDLETVPGVAQVCQPWHLLHRVANKAISAIHRAAWNKRPQLLLTLDRWVSDPTDGAHPAIKDV